MKNLFLILLLCFAPTVEAATINAASTSTADVATAIASASDGDTVVIPAGTSDWTSPLVVLKAITLQGSGTNSTIIQDSIPTGGCCWSNRAVIAVFPVTNKTTRITGIQFADGASTKSGTADGGTIYVEAPFGIDSTARAVIDNCYFNAVTQDAGVIRVYGAFGVTHSCVFRRTMNQFSHIISHQNDLPWAEATHFGTDKFWVIEDNVITKSGSLYESMDSDRGARWVFRYNTDSNSRLGMHGADSGTFQRGTRAIEAYMNTFVGDGSVSQLLLVRSGTGLVYSNTLTSWNGTNIVHMSAFRATDDSSFSWKQANGTNAWDKNDAGNPLVTGTASSVGTLTMTDSGKSWTTDQWKGYIVRNTTTFLASMITANTATTLTFQADIDGYTDPDLSFSIGNTYEINLVTKILDMPGLGQGTLINALGTPTSPDSAIDPYYAWGNTSGGAVAAINTGTPLIVENTYWFNSAKAGYTALAYRHPLRGSSRISATLNRVELRGGVVIR